MYSVLIVDDEYPVLDSYAYMIEHSGLELRLCGMARSGKEAIHIAHTEHPDIVVMDIAMPGLDGISTIKELQKTLPESLYILSTAYERFDLAQRAIPLHVFAYLVKPVSRQKFTSTLTEAIVRLEDKRNEFFERVEAAGAAATTMEREEENFLLLVSWKVLSADQWEHYRRLFALSGDTARICVVRLSSESPDVYAGVRQRLERKYRCIGAPYARNYLLFFPGDAEIEVLRSSILDAARANRSSSCIVSVGVGGHRHYTELYLSANEAFRDAGFDDELGDSERFDPLERSFRTDLSHASSLEEAYSLFRDLRIRIFSGYPVATAHAVMRSVVGLVLDDTIRELGPDTYRNLRADVQRHIREFDELESEAEWDAWTGRFLRAVRELKARETDRPLPQPLGNALRHIHEHISEPLQLSAIAEHCGVSAGYLSRLFNEHLSTSFNDYLNSIRIEAAVRYLSEHTYSIKEVAFMTGYHDPNYFSRIFRKVKGTSPSEYIAGRSQSHA